MAGLTTPSPSMFVAKIMSSPNSYPRVSVSISGQKRDFAHLRNGRENRRAELVGRRWGWKPLATSWQRCAILAGTVFWALAVAGGFLRWQFHAASPAWKWFSRRALACASGIPLAGGRPTMVVAVHPLCPCTRASVSELARLLTRCQARSRCTFSSSFPSVPATAGPGMRLARSRHDARCSSDRRSRGRRSGPLRCPRLPDWLRAIRSRRATPFPRRDHGCPGPRGR